MLVIGTLIGISIGDRWLDKARERSNKRLEEVWDWYRTRSNALCLLTVKMITARNATQQLFIIEEFKKYSEVDRDALAEIETAWYARHPWLAKRGTKPEEDSFKE